MRLFSAFFLLLIFSNTSLLVAQSINPNWIRSVAWNSAGTQISFATQVGNIQVLDIATGDIILALKFDGIAIYPLAWKPHSTQLAVGTSNETQILDVATGQIISTLPKPRSARNLSWSEDGTQFVTAAYSYPDNVIVWDTASEKIVFSPVVGDILSVALSPDKTILAIGRFGEIEFWDVATQQQVMTLEPAGDVLDMAWSPDGSQIASSYAYTSEAVIWDADTGKRLKTFKGHTDSIHSVEWSPLGDMLVTASSDHTVRIWDVASGKELVLYRSQDSIFGASFSPYGGRLMFGVTVTENNTNSLIETNSKEVVHPLADGAIQIVVPVPSLEKLQSIQGNCVPANALASLPPIETLDTDDALIAYIEAVDANTTIPLGCAADLVAIAEALHAQ